MFNVPYYLRYLIRLLFYIILPFIYIIIGYYICKYNLIIINF